MPTLPDIGTLLVRTDFADDAAAAPDPLDAALTALYAAVVTLGHDDYPALTEEVRSTHGL